MFGNYPYVRLSVRTKIKPSANVQINTNKKYASTVGMKNSQYSAIIYISYDMPDRVESKYHVSGIVYREKQAC